MHSRDLLAIACVAVFAAVLSAPAVLLAAAATADKKRPTVAEKLNNKMFLDNLPKGFEFPTDDAGQLLLREYGAVFVAKNGAVPPKVVVFSNEAEVQAYQRSVDAESEKIGGYDIVLQKPAMRALEDAVKQAGKVKLSISPRGSDSGRRGYDQTVSLWKSRVEPGLIYWVSRGRLRPAEADRIRRLPIRDQVSEILNLERFGLFFAKSLNKSIIYSVAPPGASQHIAMLALDVKEFDDPRVRSILAQHGWFQTVISDLPHFTYIGVKEAELPSLGLKKVRSVDRDFWVPDLTAPFVEGEEEKRPEPSRTPPPSPTPTPSKR